MARAALSALYTGIYFLEGDVLPSAVYTVVFLPESVNGPAGQLFLRYIRRIEEGSEPA